MAFTINSLTALTNNYIAPSVVDSTFKGSPLAYWMKEQGRLSLRGGLAIRQPIIKAQLNSSWYSGLDSTTIEALEPFTSAEFSWKWAEVPVVIPEEDIDKNSGPDGITDIVEATKEVASLTMTELLASGLAGTNSSATKQMDGLQDMGAATGTAYGGLTDTDFVSPATWLMSIRTLLTTNTLVARDLRLGRGACTRGRSKPNLGYTNFPVYAKIWKLAQDSQRFGMERIAKLGFDHVMFEDMPIMADEHSPGSGGSGTDNWFWGLNTDRMKLVIHENKAFSSRVYAPIFQQQVFLAKILFGGNLITTERRAHFVFKLIDPTL